MTNDFRAISLNHKSCPLALRERFSLGMSSVAAVLRKLKDGLGIGEAMVVSTCNRTEIYYSAKQNHLRALVKLLCIEVTVPFSDKLLTYFSARHNLEAVRHLFNVSMGLESKVLGDLQITHQIKQSYQVSADLQMAGPFLHRLMHTIFFTNKKVVQETAFRDGAASVSYAAVEMLSGLNHQTEKPNILVVGIGKIGTDVVRHLKERPVGRVCITNRTAEKAEKLAAECGFQAVPFANIWQEVAQADAIISSIRRQTPFFTREKVEKHSSLAFKTFIDLSVPRSVALSVEQIPGSIVYNIDHIVQKTDKALEKRLAAVADVEAIIEASVEEFRRWSGEMVFSPAIQQFKEALEKIRREELARYLKKISPSEAKAVEEVTKNIVNKIIKLPVIQLKAACKRGEAENLSEVLQSLFNLEKDLESKKAAVK